MTDKPLLHLVFGGHVSDPRSVEFTSTDNLDIIGMYPDYKLALDAWRGASQKHVDEANTKYVIVHVHHLIDPATGKEMDIEE